MNNHNSITIKNVRRFANAGSLRAVCDIVIQEILIKDVRIVQQAGQQPWVSMPQVIYKKGDGSTGYKTIVELPLGLKKSVDAQILAHWKE